MGVTGAVRLELVGAHLAPRVARRKICPT